MKLGTAKERRWLQKKERKEGQETGGSETSRICYVLPVVSDLKLYRGPEVRFIALYKLAKS